MSFEQFENKADDFDFNQFEKKMDRFEKKTGSFDFQEFDDYDLKNRKQILPTASTPKLTAS